MSPEQALAKRAPLDHRTDVYSLGVTLYELLTLRPAYDGGDRQEILQQISFEEPPLPRRVNKAIPPELEIIIRKAIAKNPAERYATAQELAHDLRRFLDDKPIRAKKPTLMDWTRKWARRHQGIVTTGIAGLILAVGILAVSTLVILSWYRTAITNLYHSHVREAKTLRQARGQGYRTEAWQLLQKALALQTPDKDVKHLRQEAVACLGDFVGLKPTTWEESEDIDAIAVDATGVQLAIALNGGSVVLRDLTGALIGRLPQPPCPIASLAFASERMLVAVVRGRRAQVWEANAQGDWTLARIIAPEPAFVGFIPCATFPFFVPQFTSPMIGEIAITPDGKQLCACINSSGFPTTIALWNLADGTRTARSFVGPASDQCGGVAFSPDGKFLAAVYFRDHGALPSKSTTGVLVWRLDTGQLERDVSPEIAVRGGPLGFSPDGLFLACSGDGGVALFKTSTFQSHVFTRGDATASISFIPHSQLLAVANSCLGRIKLWNYVANREVALLENVCQSRDSNHFKVFYSAHHHALVGTSRRVVRTWRLAGSGEKLTLAGHAQLIPDIAFSPDSKLLASAGFDDALKIWDATTGQLRKKFTDFRDGVRAPTFSADGRMLAASGGDGVIQIWDVASWQMLAVLRNPEPGRENLSLAFSPNGHYFAACGSGGHGGVTLWRIQAGGLNQVPGGRLRFEQIPGPSNRMDGWNLAFSPDSAWLAWVEAEAYESTTNTLRLWDLANSREGSSLPVRLTGNIRSLAFHPDRKRLFFVVDTGVAEAWDVTTGQRTSFFGSGESEERNGITSVGGEIALSSNGATLVSSHGNFLTIWDAASGQFLLKLPYEHNSITSFALSPDGNLLAAGTMDGGLAIWNLAKIKVQLDDIGLGW
jgi:WD40 repeat protein